MTSPACHASRAALAAFDVDGPDLCDEAALHLDGCASCRADFDLRFEPWREVPSVAPTPPGASGRVRGPWRRALPAVCGAIVVGVALAAGGWLPPRNLPVEDALVLTDDAPMAGDLRGVPWLVGQGSDQFGDLTVVVFWEVWCRHCEPALLHVEALYDALAADGLDVVGVTTLSKGVTAAEAIQYVEDVGLTFPQAWDRDRLLSERLGNTAWPRAYLVRDGRVVWEGHPNALEVTNLRALLR